MISDEIAPSAPIEVVEQGRVWVVEVYQQGARGGETLSTHGTQIDAVRSAKKHMESKNRPCTLRWESPRSVSNVYWNPLFETLVMQYDELLDAWTITPEAGTCAVASADERRVACERAKQIQREYDFKRLRAFDRRGEAFEERDHRFLRHDITRSGVRFNRAAIDTEPTPTPDSRADDPGPTTETDHVVPASPGQLGASIPDLTKVQFVDTDGVLHRYTTPWGDGTNAEIIALSRTVDDPSAREAFSAWASQWRTAADHSNVATVHESGENPAQWLAYRVGEGTLAEIGTDLPVDERLRLLDQIADGVAAVEADEHCGLHPDHVYLRTDGGNWQATVGDWGIEWAVQTVGGTCETTPFTAPEQLGGDLSPTTAVYQFGALAQLLLCEQPPVDRDADAAAVQAGRRHTPDPVTGVSDEAISVLQRALATNPGDRYRSVGRVRRALLEAV